MVTDDSDPRLISFGQALRDARRAADRSQGQVGDHLGVSASAVGNWERGLDEPRRSLVAQMEELFGLEPGTLSRHLGYVPTAADTTDMGSRIARLSPGAQQTIKDIIDAEERRMGERS